MPDEKTTPATLEVKALIEAQNQAVADLRKKAGEIEKKMGTLGGYGEAEKKAVLEEHQKLATDLEKKIQDKINGLEAKMNRTAMAGGDKIETKFEDRVEIKALKSWARGNSLTTEEHKLLIDEPLEKKVLTSSDLTGGGAGAPIEFVSELIKTVTEITPARSLVKVRSTSAKAMHFPKRTAIIKASRSRKEILTYTEDKSTKYALEEVPLPEAFALALVTNTDLEDVAFDLATDLMEQFGLAFALQEGQEFLTGGGVPVGEMEGILSHSGFQKVASGTTSGLTADGIKNLVYTKLKAVYWANGSFIFSLPTLGEIMKLKDKNDNYLWQPAVAGGAPALLEGKPYTICPDMDAVGTNKYPIGFGWWAQAYQIGDRRALTIQRLVELFAAQGQVGFLGTKRTGGQVVLDEAYAMLKCAVSV